MSSGSRGTAYNDLSPVWMGVVEVNTEALPAINRIASSGGITRNDISSLTVTHTTTGTVCAVVTVTISMS